MVDLIFCTGDRVIANKNSVFRGLKGTIVGIQEGLSIDTHKPNLDIYVNFEYPRGKSEIKRIEKYFSKLYGYRISIEELSINEILMAPEMLIKH